MALAVGQLREWRGLPRPFGLKAHDAEGMRFRIRELHPEEMYAVYEPGHPAGFCSAALEFAEAYSVLIEEPPHAK